MQFLFKNRMDFSTLKPRILPIIRFKQKFIFQISSPHSSVISFPSFSLEASAFLHLKKGLVAVSFLVRPLMVGGGMEEVLLVPLPGENMSSNTASVRSSIGPKGSSTAWHLPSEPPKPLSLLASLIPDSPFPLSVVLPLTYGDNLIIFAQVQN